MERQTKNKKIILKQKNIMLSEKTFPTELVSPSFQLCFTTECKKAADCIRYLAGQHTAPDRDFGPTIYPSVLKRGECPYFKQIRTIHGAWGFNALFAEIKSKDAPDIRNQIKKYLGGHGTYYNYNKGKYLLTPEQQEWIMTSYADTDIQKTCASTAIATSTT